LDSRLGRFCSEEPKDYKVQLMIRSKRISK